jgi:hypothetical protein
MSFYITGYYFYEMRQMPPEGRPDASGLEYITVAIYLPCGMVVHAAQTEEEAIKMFWDAYYTFSEDTLPWIHLHIDGKPFPIRNPLSL